MVEEEGRRDEFACLSPPSMTARLSFSFFFSSCGSGGGGAGVAIGEATIAVSLAGHASFSPSARGRFRSGGSGEAHTLVASSSSFSSFLCEW